MSELLKVFEFTAAQAKEFTARQSVTEPPIVVGDVTVIPVSRLSCGFAGGGADLASRKKSDGITAGAGVKITKTPLSFLAVYGSQVQMIQVSQEEVKSQGLIGALLPLVSQLKDKLKKDGGASGEA